VGTIQGCTHVLSSLGSGTDSIGSALDQHSDWFRTRKMGTCGASFWDSSSGARDRPAIQMTLGTRPCDAICQPTGLASVRRRLPRLRSLQGVKQVLAASEHAVEEPTIVVASSDIGARGTNCASRRSRPTRADSTWRNASRSVDVMSVAVRACRISAGLGSRLRPGVHPLRGRRQGAGPRRAHGDCLVTATSTAKCAVASGLAKRAYMHREHGMARRPSSCWLPDAAATVIFLAGLLWGGLGGDHAADYPTARRS
jgi:hypothetical protein